MAHYKIWTTHKLTISSVWQKTIEIILENTILLQIYQKEEKKKIPVALALNLRQKYTIYL